MSGIILKRISVVIEKKFKNLIDMADWSHKNQSDQQVAFLSRGLAALAINLLSNATPHAAAEAVTDGGDDGGLDAIYYDQPSETIYFVQSKWSQNGTKTIDLGTTSNFVDGVSRFINLKDEGFNEKIKKSMIKMKSILTSNFDVNFRFVLIHVGEQSVAFQVNQKIKSYVDDLNTPVKISSYDFYDQKSTYDLILAEYSTQDVKLQIILQQFGFLKKPYLSYYGRVDVRDIADWWQKYGNNIFSRNLRQLIKRSDINEALSETIKFSPENFWYLNNGVTIICNSAERARVNTDSTSYGLFNCEGVSERWLGKTEQVG